MSYEEKEPISEKKSKTTKIQMSGTMDAKYDIPIDAYKNWDPLTLKDHFTLLILGRRRLGKTEALKNILNILHHKQKRWSDAYLFSETAHLQPLNYAFVPDEHLISFFDEKRLQGLIDIQEEMIIRNENLEKKKRKYTNILIVFDDIINDPKIRNSTALNKLFISGRHLRISTIILSQEIGSKSGINKVCMSNCDSVMTFTCHSDYDRELLSGKYLSIIDRKYGECLMNKITQEIPYQAAVIDVSLVHAKSYPEYVFKFTMPILEKKFQIGKKQKLSTKTALVLKNKGPVKIFYADVDETGFSIDF